MATKASASTAHGDTSPKASVADPAVPAPGSDVAPLTAVAAEATPVGDLASMIASLLGLEGATPASGLPAQTSGGPPADATALGKGGTAAEATVALRTTGADLPPSAAAATTAGAQGGAKPPAKDAADPASAGMAAAGRPSIAGLASAALAAVSQATGRAEPQPTTVTVDTLTPPAATAPMGSAIAAGMPQLAPGVTTRQDAATAPFDAQLAAALGSPEFAPALGHQVSLLVRGGVQEARLHLNPAEMGPITVQIALDGQTAQINLAAEQPLTRQLLEQAMPALAGALREGGLTLTGGGVFEQPRDPRQSDPEARPASPFGNASSADGAPAMPATSVRTLRGAVDLIA